MKARTARSAGTTGRSRVFEDLDERSDAPLAELAEETAEHYRGEFGLSERRRPDMLHLARVVLLPQLVPTTASWLGGPTVRSILQRLGARYGSARRPRRSRLGLQPGEQPAVGLGRGHPLPSAPSRWWIPEEGAGRR
jgi:hypothetical protein